MLIYRPHALLSAILAALCLYEVTLALEVGDTLCAEGFIMDLFCIDRGTLLGKSYCIALWPLFIMAFVVA